MRELPSIEHLVGVRHHIRLYICDRHHIRLCMCDRFIDHLFSSHRNSVRKGSLTLFIDENSQKD